MALTHLLLLGAALSLTFFSGSEAGELGVCYGMRASNLIQPPAVVRLLQSNGITTVSLYDADPGALRALANTGIRVGVSLPNQNLGDAGSYSYAVQWVQNNVQAYPGTLIESVAVGNEVFHQAPERTSQLLPAMRNIQAALASAGLADAVKVVTPIALDALKVPSFPPSVGEFRDDIAQSVMRPMIDFLDQTGSYLAFNIYPYFAYKYNPGQVDLDFVLFRADKVDQNTGLTYHSLFDAMADAVFHAVDKLGGSGGRHARGRMLRGARSSMRVRESGWPRGKVGARLLSLQQNASDLAGCGVSCQKSVQGDYAQTYNSNLIKRVLSGAGTPYSPNADISVNIFSLFNEDQKPGDDDERSFGLFYPDGTPVYQVDFRRPGPSPAPGGASWCVANAAVGDKRLQDALDYACSHGADCSAIQPGKPCYQPNTVVAHASYAFDSYYQSKGRASGTCDFAGAASIVYQKPTGTCEGSWCVANAAVGDKRLQDALDYACSHGADCGPIQAGGRCFDPNTKVAHASYAFNDYYQRNGKTDQSCSFGGCGSVVHQQPTFGNCAL